MHLPNTILDPVALIEANVPVFPPVKLGLVGLNFGRTMVDILLRPESTKHIELMALCDQNESTLKKVHEDKALARYLSLDDLLRDERIEAVGLFTGPNGRADLIRKIIRSGRHVITTKPLDLDADGMLDVLREAKRLGRVVHCNSPGPLLTPDLKIIQQWIHEYDLGRPVGAHADVWASYRERADGTWYDDPERCPAAPIYRLGIYLINDLVRLFGKVEKIQLLESRVFTGRPTSDNAQISFLFQNKAVATLYASFCVGDGDQYRNGLTLHFERGSIYRNTGPAWRHGSLECCRLALVMGSPNEASVVADVEVEGRSGAYQWDYFQRAINGQRDPEEASPEEAVESIRVIQAMTKISAA